jgi:hypothetical protein
MSTAVSGKAVRGSAWLFLFVSAAVCASLLLAGCGGDDGDDNGEPNIGGGDSSTTGGGGGVDFAALSNKQVYFVDYEEVRNPGGDAWNHIYHKTGATSTDNSDVILPVTSSITVGKIQGGILSLTSMPSTSDMSGTTLRDFSALSVCRPRTDNRYSSCTSTVSAPPNLQLYGNDLAFRLTASGKENCRVKLYTEKSNKLREVTWMYSSISATMTGTETYTYSNNGATCSDIWDIRLSEGWNVIYVIDEGNCVIRPTTTLPAGTTLEWGLECN